MKEVIDKVKITAVRSLTRLVVAALENATLHIEAQTISFARSQLPPIREESKTIAARFMQNLNEYFDALTTLTAVKETDIDDYENLSLVDHDYLEAIIAMEGMVNHARNCDIQQYISFTTRIEQLFPSSRIDETNNPLDPGQIGDSFNEAIRPLGFKAHYLLTIYREFNKSVFHNLEEVLIEANGVLIKCGVLPKLDVKARNRALRKAKRAASRPTTDAQTRAFAEAEESKGKEPETSHADMFAMMQTLVKGLAEKEGTHLQLPVSSPTVDAGSAAPNLDSQTSAPNLDSQTRDIIAEQQDLKQQQVKLMQMLNNIQSTLNSQESVDSVGEKATMDSTHITKTINESLEESSKTGDIGAIEGESSDVLNLVSLLYEAIWDDDSLPVVMKELIGRTQISTMKIALSDTSFFDNEQHPGRVILNELAMAGIAWTEKELWEFDPVHAKVKDLVDRILNEKELSNPFLQGLIDELRKTMIECGEIDASLEQRIRETVDHTERLDDVHEYVKQKINERVLKDNLDPSIRSLLDTHFHNFLVKLVLKEGPGGSSWKPVMSTIDVLLWTVQAEKQPGDQEKFEKINPRLLDNLEKACEIGGASKTKITRIMRQLKQVQEYSFLKAAAGSSLQQGAANADGDDSEQAEALSRMRRREGPPLPRNDPYLRQVDKLPIGVWLEFKGAAGYPVRCTLAAKIDSIDKLFFINRQGVKVVELTRMRLARELKAGSVKIVSEGSLIDRAMESVISGLRESLTTQADDESTADLATA